VGALGDRVAWILVIPAIWYWWLLYSLSFSPDQFPDAKYAHRRWDRRSSIALFLGATLIEATIFFTLTQTWWLLLIALVAFLMMLGFVQPLLVALIIGNRARAAISRMKRVLPPRKPALAHFAWTYYLTPEEKRRAVSPTETEETKKH
jgi:hypothetical protein